jgi:hypothetical protein
MRASEGNLDQFWENINTFYDAKTGMKQHPCMNEWFTDSRTMQRTPAWEGADTAKQPAYQTVPTGQENNRQSFLRSSHDVSLQIT